MPMVFITGTIVRVHTKGVVATTRLLRRVLRRVFETAFEKVLRRVLRRCLAVGFRGRKGSEKGSLKLRRNFREGTSKAENTSFHPRATLGVRSFPRPHAD